MGDQILASLRRHSRARLRWVKTRARSRGSKRCTRNICSPKNEESDVAVKIGNQKKSTVSFTNHEFALPPDHVVNTGSNARKRPTSDLLRLHRIAKRDHSSILNNKIAQWRAAFPCRSKGAVRFFSVCNCTSGSSYFKLGCLLRLYFVFHIRISYDNSFQPPEKILIFVLLGMPKYCILNSTTKILSMR